MRNIRNTAERGTLLVEAIAMLGLIAMVTPTLYKKSAERLQEIQDINLATQARTMDSIIQSFVKSHTSHLLAAVPTSSKIELCYYDHSAAASGACASGAFNIGYSTTVPSGYKSNDLKHFEPAKVFVYNDDNKLIYYVVYPKKDELGQRRASRLASLIGANGGLVIGSGSSLVVQGVGDSWRLDNSLAHDVGLDGVAANSLVVTSNEPITALEEENDKYLYRVFDEAAYKNTMTTDLYLGGAFDAGQTTYNSIFNVRRLTLNTTGLSDSMHNNAFASNIKDVADLYIGKPTSSFLDPSSNSLGANNGAAWIYGNLSALNENLRAYNTEYGSSDKNWNRNGYDVFELVRRSDLNGDPTGAFSSDTSSDNIFFAANETGSSRVTMLNGFAGVYENGNANDPYFFVGKGTSSRSDDEGYLIKAYGDMGSARVEINSLEGATYINKSGGVVYINSGDSSSSGVVNANTYINNQGGELFAGANVGDWLHATGESTAAQVNILQNVTSSGTGSNRFTVGNDSDISTANMIYADQQKTSLRGDRLAVRNNSLIANASSNVGGIGLKEQYSSLAVREGHTLVNTKYTDILGSTYLGARGGMSSGTSADGFYARGNYTLGVAGSAWVDDLLWAHQIWAQDAGMKNFHAGFSSFASYKSSPTTGWLNVYGDDTGVVIRNRAKINSSSSVYNDDALLIADSARVDINDPTQRAFAHFQDGSTYIGSYTVDKSFDNANIFYADSSEAKVQGYDLVNIRTVTSSNRFADSSRGTNVVNVQDGAMQFAGQAGNGESYGNKILAKTGKMGIKTGRVTAADDEDDVQFYIDDGLTRLRYNTFEVQDSSAAHTAKFRVMADGTNIDSSDANVQVNGSFHVTGNDVIHIASNDQNLSDSSDVNNGHATFEVAPDYIQVRAKSGSSSFVDGDNNKQDGYYAAFKVDATDNNYKSLNDSDKNAAVYVRRGAIELETSGHSYNGDFTNMAADQGTGYIKGNRFVSNTGKTVPTAPGQHGTAYDQYMVNPAYTSVMHDIKLTTRGGARLSDILPDYILKGVYNVSNDYVEGSDKTRIKWSAGSSWSNTLDKNVAWANSYVGKLPYALCPPGYYNMATILPTSFMMGQAGHVVTANSKGWAGSGSSTTRFYVETKPIQAQILKAAQEKADTKIVYPGLNEVSSYTAMVADAQDQEVKVSATLTGWYLGLKNEGDSSSVETADGMQNSSTDQTNWLYTKSGSRTYAVAQPLYFQQNTWLKTALKPSSDKQGWDAYMGFIYDTTDYDLNTDKVSNVGITSNNNLIDGNNESSNTAFNGYGSGGNYVWNLFPVPTNSIEGHATVYCYFKRSDFTSSNTGWSDLVEDIDQRNKYKNQDTINAQAGRDQSSGTSYRERLNDPSLKYTDPW